MGAGYILRHDNGELAWCGWDGRSSSGRGLRGLGSQHAVGCRCALANCLGADRRRPRPNSSVHLLVVVLVGAWGRDRSQAHVRRRKKRTGGSSSITYLIFAAGVFSPGTKGVPFFGFDGRRDRGDYLILSLPSRLSKKVLKMLAVW